MEIKNEGIRERINMAIYILNIIGISFLALLLYLMKQHNTHIGKKIFVLITTNQLITILGLRAAGVGADTHNYLHFYNLVKELDWQIILEDRFEIGYKLINKFFALLGFGDQLFLFGISALIIIPVAIFIYKNSHNIYLSFYFYITFGFYAASFNTLRQCIAYGFVLLSFNFIKEKKPIPFLITVFLASTFHISALFFLPAYFLARIKLTKVTISILGILTLILFTFRFQIMNLVVSSIFENYSIVQTGAYEWLTFTLIIFIGAMLFYPTNKSETHNNCLQDTTGALKSVNTEVTTIRMYYILTLIGIIIMLFATTASNVMRIANYYYIFIILLIPAVLTRTKNKYVKAIITIVLFIGMGIVYIYFLNTPSDHRYVPYEFFWH